jgi:hypothetical protein
MRYKTSIMALVLGLGMYGVAPVVTSFDIFGAVPAMAKDHGGGDGGGDHGGNDNGGGNDGNGGDGGNDGNDNDGGDGGDDNGGGDGGNDNGGNDNGGDDNSTDAGNDHSGIDSTSHRASHAKHSETHGCKSLSCVFSKKH